MGKALETPVTKALDRIGVPYRVFIHPGPLNSLEQAAEERGQQPEQVVRSILFRLSGNRYVMVLVAGPEQISWQALRRHLRVSRVSMASRDQVLEQTGYQLGAVAPFGLSTPIRTIADENVFEQTEISLGSGVRGTAVIMQASDLRKALGEIEVCSCLTEPE
jgi:Cys-tRNA(Pro) deacylase